jgi:NADPH2:quinone reductase
VKAIQITRTGGPEVLEYVEMPTPRPGPREVLVKAHAIGVNMPEVLVRRGTYAWMPPRTETSSRGLSGLHERGYRGAGSVEADGRALSASARPM